MQIFKEIVAISQEIGKGNEMRALRFQTGERDITHPRPPFGVILKDLVLHLSATQHFQDGDTSAKTVSSNKKNKKSETRMTASVKKNLKIQTHKRFKRTYLSGQKHNMQIFGVIPFIKRHNDT